MKTLLFLINITIKLLKTMTKEERHAKAEAFRRRIAFCGERKQAIRSLLAKEAYDEGDEQEIKILLNRVSLAEGCEAEYMSLVERLYNDEALRARAQEFYKRWHA